jgi:hypothetical protein
MVSHLFFYQLALIARVWLFLVLHYAWPQECAQHQRSAEREPLKPSPFNICPSCVNCCLL